MGSHTSTILYGDRKMPKLSIICSAYNSEEYVKESLDSVFQQTFSDFELILINDGSTDNTRDILIGYTDRPNVRLLENRLNEGIPVSRNRALLIAQGEYIAIHDSDDVSLPSRFEEQVNFLDSNKNCTVVGSHAYKISHTGELLGSMVYPPETTIQAITLFRKYKLNPIIDPSCMYRKEVILKYGGYTMDPEFITVLDLDLWCRLMCDNYHISNIKKPLINYRVNPKGVTKTRNRDMQEATNTVWSKFRRKNFPKTVLRKDCFDDAEQYTEYNRKSTHFLRN